MDTHMSSITSTITAVLDREGVSHTFLDQGLVPDAVRALVERERGIAEQIVTEVAERFGVPEVAVREHLARTGMTVNLYAEPVGETDIDEDIEDEDEDEDDVLSGFYAQPLASVSADEEPRQFGEDITDGLKSGIEDGLRQGRIRASINNEQDTVGSAVASLLRAIAARLS